MKRKSPDFYLSTAGEYGALAAPRACWQKARLRDDTRDDYMLIDIQPALDGQRFGLGGKDITSLVLSSRHVGQTLFPPSEWPAFVYVARILDDAVFSSVSFTNEQVQLIAWGTVFRTPEEAADYAARYQR